MLLRASMLPLLLALFSFNATSTPLTWLDRSFVETAFYNVALQHEYSQGNKPLAKWKQPIKIWIDHRVGDEELHQELTELHIRHLSEVTQHPITIVNKESEANVKWIYTRQSQWVSEAKLVLKLKSTEHLNNAICTAGYRTNSKGEIVYAGIVIPVDQARSRGKLVACIVEEITQVLGLPNDSDKAYPSIFNDHTPEDLLSPLDVVLLKLLYEPELKAGMTKSEVKPIVRKILKQYSETGVLQQASKAAQQAPLYQLIGY
ncbi:DUF2927 domain-containing protein [Vibrio splendidus]|uniref:Uncharacterized protein n=1 Tax=Vibrio splendidus TaxID=29497 RepID=A0A2N7KZT8_VIBSP|nr:MULTISPECIES: DUF2927 domain-containing protein [Vibrio]MBT9243126.1 DUF2927 domain-containing protein [Vibrio splendidus]MCQ8867545.1 DUF2927 domain-containing protein [Vibrio splendidus]MDP2615210.1 DUF2927 domain-containing protein [Vibrio splendidus]OEF79875.1 hypothetical protein A148_12100 [Vibrio splendidus 1F-157]OMO33187.1 hypothetical protein BH582_07605 [Vibrio sp. 10N.222.47.A9]